MEKTQLIRCFREFCSQLNSNDRIALVHHTDPDGFCSALIAIKAVEGLIGKMPDYIGHYEYANMKQLQKILKAAKQKKLNKLIMVDIAIDADSSWKEISKPFEKALVIDHHKVYADLNGRKTVFLKATWLSKMDAAQYACSKLCFDLFGKVADVSSFDWIACVGILGDMGFSSWKGFVKKTLEKRKLGLWELHFLLDLIAAMEVMAESRMNVLLMEFYNAKKPRELLESPFRKYLNVLCRERDRLVSGFEKNAKYFPELELFIYEMKTSKEGIKSYVVNELSQMHPNQTVILIQDAGNKDLRISARRQDYKLRMNELLERAVKGIPNANAGGHVPAAAAKIRKKFKNKFKKNLIKILEKR